MDELTPTEKARAGLWLLRQAVLEVLRGRDGGMQPHEIREALGLRHDESKAPGVAMGVMKLMLDTGELDKDDGYHAKYFIKPSTH